MAASLSTVDKMDDTDLHCIVCEEDFSDDIVPRNLGCGHTLCTLCINHYFLKDRDKNCPECRQPFSAKSASDLPINYPLLRLSRSIVPQSSIPKVSHGTNPKWNSKVVIEDHGSGPVWRTSPFEYTCTISTPKKQSEFFGMKNYIAYTVTPSFSSKHVLRRYKQFDLIQEQLRIMFPQIVLPKLPEKQVLGNFSEDLIEYRKQALQTWINRICRHPILSQCDIFRLFITVSNEKLWKSDCRKMKSESLVCRSFFSSVEMPQFHFDLPQMDNKLESFLFFVNELEKSIKELQSASLVQANNYQINYEPENEDISQAFLKFGQAFSTASCEAPELPALILRVSEAYSDVAKLSTEEVEQAWRSLHDLTTEYQSLIEELSRVLSIARKSVTKAYKMEVSNYQDATIASCVFRAEVAHFTEGLSTDIKKIIKVILKTQFDFYQNITDQLRNGLEEINCVEDILNEGKVEATAPPLELFN